jgi:hypothetical protein
MRRTAQFLLATIVTVVVAAHAEEGQGPASESTRGVRIIAEPTPSEPTPSQPGPSEPATTAPAPAPPPAPPAPSVAPPAAPNPPSVDAAAPPAAQPAPPAAQPAPRHPLTAAELDELSKGIKVANPAELAIEILPGPDIAVGARVSFRVTTRKPGYLVLVDVDPTGKLSQIYPNPMSLATRGDRDSANLIRPGTPVQLPNPSDRAAGFEFIASPPLGTAMVVALLSDRPVQIIDLPDVPSNLLGSAAAATQLTKAASELRIPNPKDNGAVIEPHWSFDAKFYAIR